mgnify:FL=1
MAGYFTDVDGIKVGHYTDKENMTGCTVIIPDKNAPCGVDVRGSAPGTRETDLLNPINLVTGVDAIVLSGGSAYGLGVSQGVMEFLHERQIGIDVGVGVVPIVPQAIIFDLAYGNFHYPTKENGYFACENASYEDKSIGQIGAGTGASVGKILGMEYASKSGIGQASIKAGDLIVSALVCVNALGDVFNKEGKEIAGVRKNGRFISTMDILKSESIKLSNTNTTIGVIATNASLNKTEATKVSQMAHDGLARCINPIHTMEDGDTLFAISQGEIKANLSLVGALAAEACEEAVLSIFTREEK